MEARWCAVAVVADVLEVRWGPACRGLRGVVLHLHMQSAGALKSMPVGCNCVRGCHCVRCGGSRQPGSSGAAGNQLGRCGAPDRPHPALIELLSRSKRADRPFGGSAAAWEWAWPPEAPDPAAPVRLAFGAARRQQSNAAAAAADRAAGRGQAGGRCECRSGAPQPPNATAIRSVSGAGRCRRVRRCPGATAPTAARAARGGRGSAGSTGCGAAFRSIAAAADALAVGDAAAGVSRAGAGEGTAAAARAGRALGHQGGAGIEELEACG